MGGQTHGRQARAYHMEYVLYMYISYFCMAYAYGNCDHQIDLCVLS
jgi:hypothetical protein